MQLCKILVACCLLCGFITIAAAHFLPLEGISVKIKASKFLNSVFREKGIDLDPRTWVVDDTDKVPKTWTVRSMPQCLLTRQWMESLGWVVKLYHEETPYLKLIVRVTAKVIITPKFGMHILTPISLYPKRL
jgi:hypothetical protein